MFKLPEIPSPRASCHELADFAEWQAWQNGVVSERELLACLGRLEENECNIGCDDDDAGNEVVLDEVMNEIGRRKKRCNTGYPFLLERDGTVIKFLYDPDDHKVTLYLYMLLVTRVQMDKYRLQSGIDGTFLFEKMCAEILRFYLGGKRAQAIIFGTACNGGFKEKINALSQSLGEGGGFRMLGNASLTAKDDKLDVVAWVPFSDSLPGQLILFGQCKTGTHWKDHTTRLQPETFIQKWFSTPFAVSPMRVFCITEAHDVSHHQQISLECGILFDRCRLLDFCENLPADLIGHIHTWTTDAVKGCMRK